MNTEAPASDQKKSDLIRVFKYLKDFYYLTHPTIIHVNEYKSFLWLDDLPIHPSVSIGNCFTSVAEEDTDDFILKVTRPELHQCPRPPDNITEWLHPDWDDPTREVNVKSENAISDRRNDAIPKFNSFNDNPDRVIALSNWLKVRSRWQEREAPARKALALYEEIYAWHSILDRESESVELVVGDGILTALMEEGKILHPILISKLRIEFYPEKPEFQIIEDDSPTELYSQVLHKIPEININAVSNLRELIQKEDIGPYSGMKTTECLKVWSASLHAHGVYYENPQSAHAEDVVLYRRPAMFMRKKNYSYDSVIEKIIIDIQNNGATDLPLGGIVNSGALEVPPADFEECRNKWSINGEAEDIFFPKESNEEQLLIAHKLMKNKAVLVQGPPGTGKTHTIANLIGHLLSQGESVLVTSQKPKALGVLRNMMPESLRPLCMSLLDNNKRHLEEAVNAINDHLSSTNANTLFNQAQILKE